MSRKNLTGLPLPAAQIAYRLPGPRNPYRLTRGARHPYWLTGRNYLTAYRATRTLPLTALLADYTQTRTQTQTLIHTQTLVHTLVRTLSGHF